VIRERTFLVAVAADVVVGFGQLDGVTGEVEAIYVRPSAARSGVGSRLLSELEHVARDLGLGELFLDSSLNAVPFYTRAGFRGVERRTHRLEPDGAIACVRMLKTLIP
jgi:putative acetyltransferase